MNMNSAHIRAGGANAKKLPIILTACVYAVFCLCVAGMLLLSVFYQEAYSSPRVEKGKADFAGVELEPRAVTCILAGEWEFFFNEWIITDGVQSEPDGYLAIPGYWTGKDFGEGALPRTGYASYRLTVENVEPTKIIIYRNNYAGAFRAFINGELVTVSGTVSKNPAETVSTGKSNLRRSYETKEGEKLEIVLELSATDMGGMTGAPWLAYEVIGPYGTNLRYAAMVCFGIATAAVLFSFVMYASFRFKRDISVPLLITALYAHFLCSKDVATAVGIPFGAVLLPEFISALACVLLFVWYLCRNGMRVNKRHIIASVGAAAVAVAAFFPLLGTYFSVIPAALFCIIPLSFVYPLITSRKIKVPLRAACTVVMMLMVFIFSIELMDFLGLIVYGTEFIFSGSMFAFILFFAFLGVWHVAEASRGALRAGELERELFGVRQQALKAQIKPHFVFNSLTAIQSRYREGLAAGDEALERFARHLRLNIDSDGEELIPFEDEVKNVLNYFELENLRAGGALTLLLDLNFTEFNVPVLSLQPLVENAIRHGQTQSVKNGYILLASAISDGVITVTVEDNGKGFDTAQVKRGVGLENSAKRFEGLLGATLTVESEPLKGTRVTVKINTEE